MKLVFSIYGNIIGRGDQAASDYASDPNAVVFDAVEGVDELWRYSYDAETEALVVEYPDMTDEEALAQLEIDAAAENAE